MNDQKKPGDGHIYNNIWRVPLREIQSCAGDQVGACVAGLISPVSSGPNCKSILNHQVFRDRHVVSQLSGLHMCLSPFAFAQTPNMNGRGSKKKTFEAVEPPIFFWLSGY